MAQVVSAVRSQVAPTLVLVVAAFGAFLAFLDSTIVNVAFPSIQAAFPSTSFDSLSWVLNAYNIVFAAFLVAAGRIADLLGRRRMFSLGVATFTLASAGCAAAGSVDALIAFRVLQAFGAAVLVPASLALVVEAFPPERRAHGIGLWGAAAALAAGLGPPIGGALVQAQSWRLAFLVNVPLGIVAMFVARRTLVESRAPGIRTVPDLRGSALLALALGALTLGVVKGQDWGWGSVAVTSSFVVALGAAIGLTISSRRHPSPILDPTLLRVGPFAAANLITIVASMGFYAYLLTHILWLHYVWNYSLFKAGLAVAPGALVAAVAAGVLGRLADEHGYRRIAFVGALVWASGFAWYIWVVGTTPAFLTEWLPGQLISGLGVGATLPILASAALAAVPGGRYAGASAIVSSSRQIGAVLGIAVLVVIIGVPTASSAAVVFRHGWIFCAICFLVAAAGTLFLRDAVTVEDEPLGNAVHPAPTGPAGKREVFPFESPAAAGLPPGNDAPLDGLALFANLSDATRARIENSAEEISLLAGQWLFAAGDDPDGLYLVRTGRLEVIRDGVVVQELGHGGTLGELGVLTGAPRAASVRAKRDSHLLRVRAEHFDEISAADPVFLRTISATIAGWLQSSRATAPTVTSRPAVVALIGLDADARLPEVERQLVDAVARHLRIVAPGRIDGSGLERAEATHDRVLLSAGIDDPDWRSFCLRQADRVILVSGRPGRPAQPGDPQEHAADLVLIGDRADRDDLVTWCDAFAPRTVLQIDGAGADLAAQLRPLAARIAGRSIGLVLGGGGARALAHIGVLEELEAAGVHIDRVAGASFGALIGAMYATGLSPREIDAVCYDGLVRRNPLNDYTVPIRGLARGAKLQAALNGFFGDRVIEELPREFCAVSVDLLARTTLVHRRGRLADAIAASVHLPGLFPPYVIGNRLHVDGGVMDNLPVSALTDRDEGPIIAVNISAGSGNGRASDGRPRIPVLGDTLMRSMMLSSGATSAAALARADLVIAPEARGVGLLEFHQLDQVRAAGRNAAREALRGLTEVHEPAPAKAANGARPRPRPRPRPPATIPFDPHAGESAEWHAVPQ